MLDRIIINVAHTAQGAVGASTTAHGFITPLPDSGNCPMPVTSIALSSTPYNAGWRARFSSGIPNGPSDVSITIGDNTGAGTSFNTRYQDADNVPIMPATTYCIMIFAMNSAGSAPAATDIVMTTTLTPAPPVTEMPDEMTGGDDNTAADATDDAVLPNVLRNSIRGIHNSIFHRIQQRQRQDGRWK